MSSQETEDEPATVVARFLDATAGMSLRVAGALGGVSHTKVAEWRRWDEEGADPEALAPPEPQTLMGLKLYLRQAEEIEFRKAALKIAAKRLMELADELKEEAESVRPREPGPPEGGEGGIASEDVDTAAAAHDEAQRDRRGRSGRKQKPG